MDERSAESDDEEEMVASALALAAAYYGDAYYDKQPCHTSALSGAEWVAELVEGNPTRIFENYRMTKAVFSRFCGELEATSPPSSWAHVGAQEQAAMFIYCVSRHAPVVRCKNAFNTVAKLPTGTISTCRPYINEVLTNLVILSRHFHQVLNAVCSLAAKYIVLPQSPSTVLTNNPKFAGQFDQCRVAFDGTHIPAYVPMESAKPFRDRNGQLSQNVFAACTFDMQFAFVLSGWKGSAADSTVLADARRKGFKTPRGLFDLGGAGCGLSAEVMTPYRGVRYHLREWSQSNDRPQNYKDLFNLRHAQARNVIERAFGVLKKRFRILQRPPEYSMPTQAKIVLACCVIHNFIRLQCDPLDDPAGELAVTDSNTDSETVGSESDAAFADSASEERYNDASQMRDRIAKAMWDSYASREV